MCECSLSYLHESEEVGFSRLYKAPWKYPTNRFEVAVFMAESE